MIGRRNFAWQRAAFQPMVSLACVILLVAVSSAGCKRSSHPHTSDVRLQKIDEMLNAELPPGTPRARVEYFLNSRGYQLEDSSDKNSVVATVRHIDTDTLQPATARATFHFDSNDKLTSYDLQSAPDAPLRR
jgi:hypothetical protein